MTFTVAQIAAALGTEAAGDTSITIGAPAEPADAGPGDLAMAMSPKYADGLKQGQARVALLWPGADWQELGLEAAIFAPRPRMAMSGVTALMDPGQRFGEGIHPTAVVDPSAELGEDVSVGPMTVIGPGARIGDGSAIGPLCYVGAGAVLGAQAYLRESVSIGANVRIGDRFIAQPGARIGSDGFSFVTPEVSGVELARATMGDQGDTAAQSWIRIHSLGGVVIGDDVEIGANSTVDSGTVRPTQIGNGTKLDNLVHLGHNVKVGKDCLLCGQVGIAGSVVVGDNVVLAGQVGVVDNITIGDRVIAGGASKILSNVPAGRMISGYPAVKMDMFTEMYKALRRLPRLASDIAVLKKAVFKDEPNE